MFRNTNLGFVVFFVAVIISRVIGEKALKKLSTEEKVRLIDGFSGSRITSTVVLLGIVILFFGLITFYPQTASSAEPVFLIAFVLVTISMTLLRYRRLKLLDLPAEYTKTSMISTAIQYVGLAFLYIPLLAIALR